MKATGTTAIEAVNRSATASRRQPSFCRLLAKTLLFLLVIQGLTLWQWLPVGPAGRQAVTPPAKIVEALAGFGPAAAAAAPPQVICVPQLPSDLLVPHETWSGEETILKGVARDEDGDLASGTYYWEFGDGEQSDPAAITDPDNLAAVHTYTGVPGTLIVAHLHVTDAAGETSVDEYRLLIKERTLDVEVNKAIDDGLWWLYTHRETLAAYSTIPPSHLEAPDGAAGLLGEYFNNTTLTGPTALTRIDPVVDFDWSTAAPGNGVNADYFSVRWTGKIKITHPGEYRLATASDDGVKLYVDGNLVINDWRTHGRTWNYSPTLNLTAGTHEVVLEYFENNGTANVGLYWMPPGQSYCRWNNVSSGNHYANTTASAVQAFEINGYLETGDDSENPYAAVVRNAIDYLLTTLVSTNMTNQDHGHPEDYNDDGDPANDGGNGIGLAVNSGRSIYELGAVMDALVATGTPDAIARTGGANVKGRRYQDLVQDMADMYSWGQGDWDNGGGWRYTWNAWPDNSASQWGAIGLIAAERHFGCRVPSWVKEQNNRWLDQSYNSAGYFGYTSPGAHRNGYATGPSGMVQLSFAEKETTDPRWQQCQLYLDGRWNDFIRSSRDCRYYSYFAFAKAMRLALPHEVTHLPSGRDWYGDETTGLARALLNQQLEDGSWPYDGWPYVGVQTSTAWNVIILTRTLFEKPPVAVIHAEPNPGAVGQTIQFDASDSYHTDPAKEIVRYLWDFDAEDGVDFEHPDATGPVPTWAFGELRDYTVSLKVIDNSTPERFDITQYVLHITVPPHPPTAVIGGPYIGVVGEAVQVDGSGSYDIDEGDGDAITAWAWEADFAAPYDFGEAYGQTTALPPYAEAGRHDLALRVTDNTATAFPGSGQPDLTDVAYGEIMVYEIGVTDLRARPKGTKCQLTWSHIGVDEYEVLRSTKGPNEAFTRIGITSSTYSTFIDYNVEMNRDYWYRVRCRQDGKQVLSVPVHVYSRGRLRNRPPVITSTPPADRVQEEVPYQYDVDAVDPEGRTLTYILDLGPAGMTIDGATGLLQWTPTAGQAGPHDVMVRVQDAGRAATTQFFTLMVTPAPNTPPTARLNGPYESLVNEAVTFDASGSSDPDGAGIADYHWVFGDGSDAHGRLVTHAYAAPGDYVVTLYVTDNDGATGHAESSCQVGLPNRRPTANAGGPYVGEINAPIHFNGIQSYDPDADPLTYTWNFGDSTPARTGVQIDHVYTALGIYHASLMVSDGRGGMDTMSFEVTVTPENQAPTAVISRTGLDVALETITFDGRGSSDPDGNLANFEWNFGDGNTTTGPLVTHAFPSAGSYTVTLTVTDDKGATNSTDLTLTVTANQAPTAKLEISGNFIAGQEIAFSAAGSGDPENPELTYAWDFGDGTTATDSNPKHTYSAAGTYTVTLTVTDHVGLATETSRTVNVASSDGPVAVFSVSGSMVEEEVVQFDASDSYDQSSGGSVVGYAWDFGDGTTATGVNPTHIYAQPGNYPVRLTVTDDDGLSSAGESTLTIGPNQPPQALFGYSGVMTTGGTITFDGSSSYDPEGHDLTAYHWDFGDGTEADTSEATHAFAGEGDYTVALTVTDDRGQETTGSKVLHIVSAATAPQASCNVSGEYVVGQSLSFDGSASTPPPGRVITAYEWDFGDGATATGIQVDHVYDRAGRYETVLRVTDDQGGWSEAHVFFGIYAEANHDPSGSINYPEQGITNEPVAMSAAGSDPDGDSLTYEWDFGDGSTATGAAVSHTYTSVGNYSITATIADGRGGTAVLTGQIEVIARPDHNVAPVAGAGGPYQGNINEAIIFDGSASYDLNLDSLTYTWNFGDGATGTGANPTHTYVTAGTYTVSLTVTDPDGLTDSNTASVRVIDPADITPPDAVIEAPAPQAVITAPVAVVGTVADTDLASWKLEYAHQGDSRYTLLASGNSEVQAGELGTFDPTTLMNGFYVLRLTATDLNGHITTARLEVQVTGKLKVGFFSTSFIDFSIPLSGIPIQIKRTYDSRDRRPGDFGHGWTIDVKSYPKVEKSGKEGEGWSIISGGGFLTTYCFAPSKAHYVTVEMPDGRTLEFDFTPRPDCQVLYPLQAATAAYTARPGTAATLEPLDDRDLMVINGELYTYDVEIYDPQEFLVTMEDGTKYWFSLKDGLKKLEDRYQNSLTFTPDGIIHSSGQSLVFSRDAAGRIEKITAPDGTYVTYEYDGNGNLTTVTDRNGNRTTFSYVGDHYLESIHDPLGRTVARNEYDAAGRLTARIDAEGNRIEYTHDVDGRQEMVEDRLGQVTVFTYDDRGLVIAKDDPLGRHWTYTYDSYGHKKSETDPLGHTTTYVYDAKGHLLSKTDPLGHTTSTTYNTRGQVLTTTNALGQTTTNVYDGAGNLIEIHAPDGGITRYSYNSRGEKTAETDPLGNVTTYEYDGNGRLVKKTDPLGNVTTFTYDALGRVRSASRTRTTEAGPVTLTTTKTYDAEGNVIAKTMPNGATTLYAYDALGHKVKETRPDGTEITYNYDPRGNLTATLYPDGTTDKASFDAENHKISTTDRAGRTTTYTYDAAGQLVEITYPDGSTTTNSYDDAGRLVASTNGRGFTMHYEYDPAGRRTKEIDALGKETVYAYNAVGRLLRLTDPLGRTTEYEYDAAGRLVKTTFADGTSKTTAYDFLGRKVAETDQGGKTTHYEYDALGRLIRVTDPTNHQITYSYDEVGNKIEQVDANGHLTRWSYNNAGQVTRHTLPLGMSESFVRDYQGNVLEHTDFNGDTIKYSYDFEGHCLAVNYPDGTSTTYTYTPTGKRETVTDAAGTTRYTYDARDRLLEVRNPDGSFVAYTYDAAGNRLTVTGPAGTTNYVYDGLNRLISVYDNDGSGRQTRYEYDAAGNRLSQFHSNGIITRYRYDALNRLVYLEHEDAAGTILASYSYTLGPAGNRLRVAEAAGRTVNYTYDDLYRLVREDIVDPVQGDKTIEYSYDPMGNRLTKTDDTGTVVYTYDENDRLRREQGPGYDYDYTYDDNGNRTARDDGSAMVSYTFNYDNRLTSVRGANTVNYAYDADGLRIAQDVNGVVTRYLYDPNRPHAAVIEERAADGTLTARYTRGDDLHPLLMVRDGAVSDYLADGNLNVRLLTNEAGVVTDTYILDAFGNLLARTGSTPNRYLLHGQYYDANTGFYYLRARWLDPAAGCFLSLDPVVGSIFEPQTLHRYVYARNNPLNYYDPSGEFGTLIEVSISISIESNLIKAYNTMLLKVFINSMRIIACIIRPASELMGYGLFLAADPDLSQVGLMFWQIGRKMVAIGYNQIYKTIRDAAEEFARSLLPKIEIGLNISFTFKSDFMNQLAGIYHDIEEIREKLEKINEAIETLNSIKEAVMALASGRDCAFWSIVSNFT